MSEVRCWRCDRKVAEAEGITNGQVVVQCKGCRAKVVISAQTVAIS